MRILVFTEGTILTHTSHIGLRRETVVELVKNQKEPFGPQYFVRSVPIGNSVRKIKGWKKQGATLAYATSRRTREEVQIIRDVLLTLGFPEGELFFRKTGEEYKDVVERVLPDVIVEDDCESIGGEKEMMYPHIKQELKPRIKSIVVREFGGIDHLPNDIIDLLHYE
jgi:hypothetical protein